MSKSVLFFENKKLALAYSSTTLLQKRILGTVFQKISIQIIEKRLINYKMQNK
jgi:hypothetical protein